MSRRRVLDQGQARAVFFGNAPVDKNAIVFPITPEPYRSYDELDLGRDPIDKHRKKIAAAFSRRFMPYRDGEVLFINIANRLKPPSIRLVRVLSCHWHETRRGVLLPKWQIQLASVGGRWTQQSRYCYPGDIYRAYHKDREDTVRQLPTVLRSIADLDAIRELT